MYHIGMRKGDVGAYCILPGDPGRCQAIAAHFDKPRKAAQNREFTTYTGFLHGEPVSVTSTGIGGPSAVIALEELVKLGVHTFIRVGTCGGIALPVRGGDLVVATGAVRHEGTSREYAPLEYPAVPHWQVLSALCTQAALLKKPWHAGVVQCKDSFYGQHDPARMPVSAELLYKWEAWKRLGVLASEMEAAALFVAGAALDVRVGACFQVVWNQERRAAHMPDEDCHDTSAAVLLGVKALTHMIDADHKTDEQR